MLNSNFSIKWLTITAPFLMLIVSSTSPTTAEETTTALNQEKSTFAPLDLFLTDSVEKGRIVGASALVIQENAEKFYGSWGYKDAEKGEGITRNTIFRIYSMTKPITSLAAMQLVEQGKIALDNPVSDYLPEFGNLGVSESARKSENPRQMTIRDLLRHTSGLTYGFFDLGNPVDQLYLQRDVNGSRNLEQLVKRLSDIPLKHSPGMQFEYSVSTDVLARVIEVVSGERFDRYLQKNILDPLGMNDTSFVVPANKRDRLATMYSDDGTGGLSVTPAETSKNFTDDSLEFFSGGGGLCSTIDDYAKFAKMLVNKGESVDGKPIIKASTLNEMFTNQLSGIDRPKKTLINADAPWVQDDFAFGLGFSIGQSQWGKDYTWNGIAGTQFWVNPEKDIIMVYMVQVFPLMGHDLAPDVKRLCYEALNP